MKKKFLKFICFSSLLISLLCNNVSGAYASAPQAPKNLQATITGSNNNNLVVNLQWDGEPGLNYLLTKVFPDGRTMQFVIHNAITDPNCIMRGGVFKDSLVEAGKKYTYKIKALDGFFNYSAESSISINVIAGDTAGCWGTMTLSLETQLRNFTLNASWSNPDNIAYDVYLNEKFIKSINGNQIKIWPVFGKKHKIAIKESASHDQGVFSGSIAQSASACNKTSTEEAKEIEKNYDGFLGHISSDIDVTTEFIKSRLAIIFN